MSNPTFDRRVASLKKRHRLLAGGMEYKVGPDGLITARPVRRILPSFPIKPLLLLVMAGYIFKVILFTAAGEAAYDARLAQLESGRKVEQAMAWAMQPDRAMVGIASVLTTALEAIRPDLP